MKGIIDTQGTLTIQRKSKYKSQMCPYYNHNHCSDRCPKFGEPYESFVHDHKGNKIYGLVIKLCDRDQLFFTELDDQR